MKTLSLVLRIVAIVAAIVATGAYFMAQGKLSEQEDRIATIQSEAQARAADLETANQEIKRLDDEVKKSNNALAQSKRSLDSARSEMSATKQELAKVEQTLREEKSKSQKLATATERLKATLLRTEESLAAASKEGEIALLSDRIRELESANEELKQEVSVAESKVKTLSTTSRPNTSEVANNASGYSQIGRNRAPAVQPATIGEETTIASANPSAGIIVLNAPESLGITVGSTLTLIRGLELIGKVEVTQVSNKLAVANILPGSNTREMTSGSPVKILR